MAQSLLFLGRSQDTVVREAWQTVQPFVNDLRADLLYARNFFALRTFLRID